MGEKEKKELNLLLISMSKLARSPSESYYKHVEKENEAEDYFCGISQLEAGTKCYIRRLQREGRKIDKIFIVESVEARKEFSEPKQRETHCFSEEEMNAVGFYKGRICQYIEGKETINVKCESTENLENYEKLAKDVEKYNEGLKKLEEKEQLIPLSDLYPEPDKLFVDVKLEDVNKKGKTDEDAIYFCASELCKEIQECKDEENKTREVKLFIDMQGARRFETFIINAAVKMLDMRGIEVESSIATNFDPDNNKNGYFNEVVDTTMNDRMFDMVSGMQEFINTGRGDTLQKFKASMKEKLDAEQDIIDAIICISNSISLCNVKNFDQGLNNFKIKYDDYVKLEDEKKEPLFKTYVDDLKNDYGKNNLLEEDETNKLIGQVKWCLRKKLYQQALTILEAKTPDYMVYKNYIDYNAGDQKTLIDLVRHINSEGDGWTPPVNYLTDGEGRLNAGSEIYAFIKYALGWKPFRKDLPYPNADNPLIGLSVKGSYLNSHGLKPDSHLRTYIHNPQVEDYVNIAKLLIEYSKICDLRNDINHSSGIDDERNIAFTDIADKSKSQVDNIEEKINYFLDLLSENKCKINLYDEFDEF